nr:autoinducer binding domain-containing protein [Agrobacterium vitis]
MHPEDRARGLRRAFRLHRFCLPSHPDKHIIAVTNYHREWQSTYFDKKFDALDPVVKRARSRKHVFAWSGSRNGRGCRRKSAPSMRMRPITASLRSSFLTNAANPS